MLIKIVTSDINEAKVNGIYSQTIRVFGPSGEELKGITSVDVRMRIGEVVRASVDLLCVFDELSADAVFRVINPYTRVLSEIKKIEFKDGSVFPKEEED